MLRLRIVHLIKLYCRSGLCAFHDMTCTLHVSSESRGTAHHSAMSSNRNIDHMLESGCAVLVMHFNTLN